MIFGCESWEVRRRNLVSFTLKHLILILVSPLLHCPSPPQWEKVNHQIPSHFQSAKSGNGLKRDHAAINN